MWIADGWEDYELLDCGGGEKLERWGQADSGASGPAGDLGDAAQRTAAGTTRRDGYHRSSSGGGHWDKDKLPESWQMRYKRSDVPGQAHELQAYGPFPRAGRELGLCA